MSLPLDPPFTVELAIEFVLDVTQKYGVPPAVIEMVEHSRQAVDGHLLRVTQRFSSTQTWVGLVEVLASYILIQKFPGTIARENRQKYQNILDEVREIGNWKIRVLRDRKFKSLVEL